MSTDENLHRPYQDQDEVHDSRWTSRRVQQLTLACALAQASVGYGSATSNMLPLVNTIPASALEGLYIRQTTLLLVVGNASTLGAIASAILILFVGGFLGRKKSTIFGLLVSCVGCIIELATTKPGAFIAGRVCEGIGFGFITAAALVWQVEVSTVRTRGRLVLVQLTSRLAASVLAAWLALTISNQNSTDGLTLGRGLVAIQLVFIAPAFVGMVTLPESYGWNQKNIRIDRTLKALAPGNRTEQEPHPVWSSHTQPPSYDTVSRVSDTKKWRRLAIGCSLFILYAFSGDTAITAYAQTVLLEAGFTFIISYRVAVGMKTLMALCCGLGIAVVEAVGRRRALQTAFAGQAVLLVPITILLYVPVPGTLGGVIGFEICAYLFMGLSGFLYGMIWLYVVEINASSFRLAGSAMAAILQYGIGFAMIFVLPRLEFQVGWPAVFIAANLLGICLIYLVCPETTGRKFGWLDGYYQHGPTIICRTQMATKVEWTSLHEDIAMQPMSPRY